MDDTQFEKLLEFLGFSWKGYRKVRKGVKKRISRHMRINGLHTMAAYLEALTKDTSLFQELESLMLVPITRFFRDRELWQALEARILPDLIHNQKKPIRIWSAGCSNGDEVYSFQIIWNKLRHSNEKLPSLEIVATDANPVSIKNAREGLYPVSSLREVDEIDRSEYFETGPRKHRFAIKPSLKNNINWQIQMLPETAPDGEFDIIFLRNNVLTYYDEPLKIQTIEVVLAHLAPGGIFIIGCHEKIPKIKFDLEVDNQLPYAFHNPVKIAFCT
jgi:chemotaxis protein methyltransferase CheR